MASTSHRTLHTQLHACSRSIGPLPDTETLSFDRFISLSTAPINRSRQCKDIRQHHMVPSMRAGQQIGGFGPLVHLTGQGEPSVCPRYPLVRESRTYTYHPHRLQDRGQGRSGTMRFETRHGDLRIDFETHRWELCPIRCGVVEMGYAAVQILQQGE